jgi:nucleoid DNA-binding protein
VKRDDVVRRCADRGVADSATVGKVYDGLRDFLAAALQRGQDVHVPSFGTFTTRIAGARKVRRVPAFEPEENLADEANERFREMKYLLLGTYDQTTSFTGKEYTGKKFPSDALVEELGPGPLAGQPPLWAEGPGDAHRTRQRNLISQEATPMPRLNLRDDGLESDSTPLETEKVTPAPPTLRDVGGGGGARVSPILLVALIVVVLGGGVFLLNQFKIVHLWGKKAPKVAESIEQTLPEPEGQGDQGGQSPEGASEAGTVGEPAPGAEQSPAPEAAPEVSTPEVKTPPAAAPAKAPARKETPVAHVPAGTGGRYTVQVSSWPTQEKADEEAGRLAKAGLDAYVQAGDVAGSTWFRVRIGHYGTQKEAEEAADQMQKMMEGTVWIARAGR